MVIGKPERETQNRVITLFREELGYRYLGDWTDRASNSNIEEGLLTTWLTKSGYSTPQINRALDILRREADNHNRTLYGNNQEVYKLLIVAIERSGKVTDTIHLIKWNKPLENDFYIALDEMDG